MNGYCILLQLFQVENTRNEYLSCSFGTIFEKKLHGMNGSRLYFLYDNSGVKVQRRKGYCVLWGLFRNKNALNKWLSCTLETIPELEYKE